MAVGNYTELVLPVRATTAITARRGITIAGGVPAAGANGYLAVFDGVSGDMVSTVALGTAQAEAGAAFAANIALQFDSTARLITATSGAVVARSVTAAGAAGDVAEVLVIPN